MTVYGQDLMAADIGRQRDPDTARTTWGFQLVIGLPQTFRVTGDRDQTWTLGPPVGDVDLVAPAGTMGETSELQFRSGGFETQEEALAAGEILRSTIRLVAGLHGGGFDVGEDIAVSAMGEHVRAIQEDRLNAEGAFLVDDVLGLIAYEERGRPVRIAIRAAPLATTSSDSLRDQVRDLLVEDPLSAGEALACDMIAAGDRELSGRAKLITLITAMEVLAERPGRTGRARELLDGFIETATAAAKDATAQDRVEIASLLDGLRDLRKGSISGAVRQLASRARPTDDAAATTAKRLYNCRSQLVHAGCSADDPTTLLDSTLRLVRDMLRWSLAVRAASGGPDHRGSNVSRG